VTYLSAGTTLKVIAIDQSKVVGVDWLNEREPCAGDVVLVESISGAGGERIIRLLCEPRVGFLEWRIDVLESGLQFESFTNA
jgi:hypothetical protein